MQPVTSTRRSTTRFTHDQRRAKARGKPAPHARLSLIDDDELAGVVSAEPSIEIVLRRAHRTDASDDTRRLGVTALAGPRRVVDRERNELVAVVRATAKPWLVRASAGHAHEAGTTTSSHA